MCTRAPLPPPNHPLNTEPRTPLPPPAHRHPSAPYALPCPPRPPRSPRWNCRELVSWQEFGPRCVPRVLVSSLAPFRTRTNAPTRQRWCCSVFRALFTRPFSQAACVNTSQSVTRQPLPVRFSRMPSTDSCACRSGVKPEQTFEETSAGESADGNLKSPVPQPTIPPSARASRDQIAHDVAFRCLLAARPAPASPCFRRRPVKVISA